MLMRGSMVTKSNQGCKEIANIVLIMLSLLITQKNVASDNSFATSSGWGTVIRTQECRSQSPMPYRLAIPQYKSTYMLAYI